MTRGRKALPAVVQEGPDFVTTTPPDLAAQEERVRQRLGTIAATFGDGLPYHRDRLVDKCRYHMSRSAEEALEVGRCLIQLREHEAHGSWGLVLHEIGIDPRMAQRMMQAAARFSNAALTPHLIEAARSKTKLLELLVLDDEEIKELSDGGTVAGLDLDDVAKMTVSELRAALREAREDHKAKDQLLADKNAKIDKLARDSRKARPGAIPWPDEVAGLKDDANEMAKHLDGALGQFLGLVDATEAVLANLGEPDDFSAEQRAAHAGYKTVIHHLGGHIERIATLVAGLRNEYELRLAGHVALDKTHVLPADEQPA